MILSFNIETASNFVYSPSLANGDKDFQFKDSSPSNRIIHTTGFSLKWQLTGEEAALNDCLEKVLSWLGKNNLLSHDIFKTRNSRTV